MKKVCFFLRFLLFCACVTPVASGQGTDSLGIMIGQMLCVGIGDGTISQENEALLADISAQKVGGVLLYEKNLKREQTALHLRQLIEALQLTASTPLWVAIDEEGGKVSRLRPDYGFISTFSAAFLGQKGPKHTKLQATRMATQLRSLGINLNFAPVVDLAINPNNTVIVKAERSYGRRSKVVVMHAAIVVEAHRAAGITSVLKHFPGHGSSDADTHVGMADVTDKWQEEELSPYRQLIEMDRAPAIMSAHVVNGHLDPDKYPATLSKSIIKDCLRGILDYQGVIFSDDLHMSAIRAHYSLKEAIFLAVDAGIDVLVFSNNLSDQDRDDPAHLHATLRALVAQGWISPERIRRSYRRIMALKAPLFIANER